MKETLYGRDCVKALNDFACQVHFDTYGKCPESVPPSDSVPRQIAKQMEPVNTFMNTFQHIPVIGALLFKTT